MKSLRLRSKAAVTLALAALALSACSSPEPAAEAGATAGAEATEDASWPRTITHEAGETVIEAKPERIVSTAMSATGTLLAIDAPVVASAASKPDTASADANGFFRQWGDLAVERGVEILYPNLEFDLEAVIAAEPDLVIVSTSGADSVLDQYAQLSELFPTIVVDYSSQTWQDLATELGAATGLEDEAAAAAADFDAYVADAAKKITVDPGVASIVSYNGAESDSAVAKTTSPWAQLFDGLGIEVVAAPDGLDTSEQVRQDVAWVSFENLTAAIGGDSVFLLSGEAPDVERFLADPTLANLPAVQSKQVYPMGLSFRLDLYSATSLVDTLVEQLS
ncbi:Fe2+-enterobactin ABC transporter substrate-binding protein [Cellulomonas cellasea]|uniref:Fe2+-enterobactin ABC transporter substrate-binding protein n=1 Tax=Cellulomonas cellasea TaxID=43670 RepID=UPI0025A369BB|nr:Fe2+-enterobactin ABC transporter substrate-binding protein [Cellulomonas cellasea]MDM8084922.1 Fe2+-enterobactin ABC transporter substrate-binding protein [Cellulomonas cellasea]